MTQKHPVITSGLSPLNENRKNERMRRWPVYYKRVDSYEVASRISVLLCLYYFFPRCPSRTMFVFTLCLLFLHNLCCFSFIYFTYGMADQFLDILIESSAITFIALAFAAFLQTPQFFCQRTSPSAPEQHPCTLSQCWIDRPFLQDLRALLPYWVPKMDPGREVQTSSKDEYQQLRWFSANYDSPAEY